MDQLITPLRHGVIRREQEGEWLTLGGRIVWASTNLDKSKLEPITLQLKAKVTFDMVFKAFNREEEGLLRFVCDFGSTHCGRAGDSKVTSSENAQSH